LLPNYAIACALREGKLDVMFVGEVAPGGEETGSSRAPGNHRDGVEKELEPFSRHSNDRAENHLAAAYRRHMLSIGR
jgi:hypothetical protein